MPHEQGFWAFEGKIINTRKKIKFFNEMAYVLTMKVYITAKQLLKNLSSEVKSTGFES